MRMIEQQIVEAASDYKMATENEGFADAHGGEPALRAELFRLVREWEGYIDEEGD